jgi:hypothetical protein
VSLIIVEHVLSEHVCHIDFVWVSPSGSEKAEEIRAGVNSTPVAPFEGLWFVGVLGGAEKAIDVFKPIKKQIERKANLFIFIPPYLYIGYTYPTMSS